LGDFDNQDASGNVKSWEDEDSNTYAEKDEIDMGYHYWGVGYHWVTGVGYPITYDLDEMEIPVTLRHPKDASFLIFHVIGGEEEEFHPDGDPVVASSSYDGEDITISCFPTDTASTSTVLMCYKRFRGDEDSQGVVAQFQSDFNTFEEDAEPRIDEMAMTTGASASGTMSETIYLSFSVSWRCERYLVGSQLQVYRYEPAVGENEEEWICIADQVLTDTENLPYFHDVALAAYTDTLTVMWIQEDYDGMDTTAAIYGYRIFDAAITTTVNTEIFSEKGWIKDIPYISTFESHIDADWDEDINKPRIAWTEWDSVDDVFKTHAAQVTFDSEPPYQPDGVYLEYVISDEEATHSTENPSIAVNRFSLPGITHDDVPEVFTGYMCYHSAIRVDCESVEGTDTWQDPVTIDEDYGMYPWETWVTYRAFGSPRQIWIKSSKIYTDKEVLDSSESRNSSGVKLCTNRNNRKDIYSSYSQYADYDRKIMIQQLEP
jgi:hypothetical protein